MIFQHVYIDRRILGTFLPFIFVNMCRYHRWVPRTRILLKNWSKLKKFSRKFQKLSIWKIIFNLKKKFRFRKLEYSIGKSIYSFILYHIEDVLCVSNNSWKNQKVILLLFCFSKYYKLCQIGAFDFNFKKKFKYRYIDWNTSLWLGLDMAILCRIYVPNMTNLFLTNVPSMATPNTLSCSMWQYQLWPLYACSVWDIHSALWDKMQI